MVQAGAKIGDRFEEGQIPRLEGAGAVLFVVIVRRHTYLYAGNRL